METLGNQIINLSPCRMNQCLTGGSRLSVRFGNLILNLLGAETSTIYQTSHVAKSYLCFRKVIRKYVLHASSSNIKNCVLYKHPRIRSVNKANLPFG